MKLPHSDIDFEYEGEAPYTDPDDLATGIQELIEQRVATIRVRMPVYVLSYDEEAKTVVVQPILRERWKENQKFYNFRLKPFGAVPVRWPGPLTFPINPGDPGELVFMDRSIMEWKTQPEPRDIACMLKVRNHLNEAVFIPGLRSPAAPYPEGFHAPGATTLSGEDVRLGSSEATEHVALSPKLVSLLAALETWAPTSADGVALKSLLTSAFGASGWSNGVAATKVKAK